MATWRIKISRASSALRSMGNGLALVSLAAGCATVGVSTPEEGRRAPAGRIDVRVERCIDRTQTQGRDLGLEATRAFEEKLRAANEFLVAESAKYILACEVSAFVEGSAFKRWLAPGWGATVGQVSAMLTESKTGELLIIARGNATVSGGGFYTIGADSYIVAAAVENVVEQLRRWARGEPAEGGGKGGRR